MALRRGGLARHRARHRRAARGAALRLRLPGVRAVRPPARVAERRLRAARHAARASGGAAPTSCSSASASATLADARPRTLSGGERQRVALARALARRPAALLLDEPLAALDPRTRAGAGRELAALLRDAEVPALLVTHDFTEAALLGDRVGIVDRGRVIQAGTAGELAAAPASAFVADFTGATVLTGEAAPGADGLTRVALDGGGSVASVEPGQGRVAVSVYPWEVALDAPEAVPTGSAQNHVVAEVVSVTAVGNRIRVGMATPQPLVAEITGPVGARARARAGRARRRDVEGRRDARAPALRSGGMADALRGVPATGPAHVRGGHPHHRPAAGAVRARVGRRLPAPRDAGGQPAARRAARGAAARARPGRAVHGAQPRARVAQRRPRLRRPRRRDGAARRHRRRGRPPAARARARAGGGPVRARPLARAPVARLPRPRGAAGPARRGRGRTSAGWPSRCRRSSPPRSIAVYRLEHETWTGSWWRAMEWEHVRSLRLASR